MLELPVTPRVVSLTWTAACVTSLQLSSGFPLRLEQHTGPLPHHTYEVRLHTQPSLQPHWPFRELDKLMPAFVLAALSERNALPMAALSFRPQLKCHLLRKAFSDQPHPVRFCHKPFLLSFMVLIWNDPASCTYSSSLPASATTMHTPQGWDSAPHTAGTT